MLAKRWVYTILLAFVLLGGVAFNFGQNPTMDLQEKKVEEVKNEKVAPAPPAQPLAVRDEPRVARREILVPSGTRIPLSMVNFVSSRTSRPGDPVFLETMFPIAVGNRVVIPVGSYVRGTISDVKRSGRVTGRAEMYIRFDSLTLPNGTTRDFNATLSQADARVPGSTKEGKIEAEGTKGRDVGTIAGTAAGGAGIGSIAGISSGHSGLGTAIGAGAGAVAGLIIGLVQRGREIDLYRGTEVDMTLDRNLVFDESELLPFTRDPYGDRYSDRPGPPPKDDRTRDSYDQYGRRRIPPY